MYSGFLIIFLIGSAAAQPAGLISGVVDLLGGVLGGVGNTVGGLLGAVAGDEGLLPFVGNLLEGVLGGLIGQEGLLPIVGNLLNGLGATVTGLLGTVTILVIPLVEIILASVIRSLSDLVGGQPTTVIGFAVALVNDIQRQIQRFERRRS